MAFKSYNSMKKYIFPKCDITDISKEDLLVTSGNSPKTIDDEGYNNSLGDDEEYSKRVNFYEEKTDW